MWYGMYVEPAAGKTAKKAKHYSHRERSFSTSMEQLPSSSTRFIFYEKTKVRATSSMVFVFLSLADRDEAVPFQRRRYIFYVLKLF